jgi:hypothetical protein
MGTPKSQTGFIILFPNLLGVHKKKLKQSPTFAMPSLEVSEQAFSWWFQFATLDGFTGTEVGGKQPLALPFLQSLFLRIQRHVCQNVKVRFEPL